MIHKLEHDLKRRQQAKIDYYFGAIGMLVKKRRLQQKKTQEEVAKGICSNTYLSKFEHNSVAVNEEYLGLIMEKIELGYECIVMPDEMLEIFHKALHYYITDDRIAYEKLISGLIDIEFAVLIDIARLGYFVMTENVRDSENMANDLHHYLSSMDNEALGVFLLFNAASKVNNSRYDEAIKILNLFDKLDTFHERLSGIVEYLKFVCYGYLGLTNPSRTAAENARIAFSRTGNYRRLAMMDLFQMEFSFYETNQIIIPSSSSYLVQLNIEEINKYHLLLALGSIDFEENLEGITPESRYYPEAMFLKCLNFFEKSETEKYRKTKVEMRKNISSFYEGMDYVNWLIMMESSEPMNLKDFLVETILPFSYRTQNLRHMRLATDKIVEILVNQKRYKDALTYKMKLETDIDFLRGIKKPTLPESDTSAN